ncbi:MAG: serine kinase [Planctomycetota bacterium]
MRLADLVEPLGLEARSAREGLDRNITGGYASDLLSDVLANSREGNVWVTLQIHQNIVAVASLKELAGIILVGGREPEEDTVQKAEREGIPVLVSRLPAFELVGRLHGLGVRGAGVERAAERGGR